jgi:hypothetical protein
MAEGAEIADRMAREQGHDLDLPVAQDQDQAYLLTRGRRLAQDLDLAQDNVQDLVRLGELDCIAQHPGLSPGMAQALVMLGDEQARDVDYWEDQYQRKAQWCATSRHRHATNETCDWYTLGRGEGEGDGPGPGPEPAQDLVQTAPDPGDVHRRDIPDNQETPRQHLGHPHSRTRANWKDRVRNEGIGPITAYLEQDQDDDHDWRPT